MAVDIPNLVRQRALANGAAGHDWLEQLPHVVETLSDSWGLTLGPSFAGGSAGCVAAATDSSGAACVLKVAMSLDSDEEDAFRRSVRVHQIANGRGCARLLMFDAAAPAMLLERLGPNLADLGLEMDAILETIATTLRSFWRPLREGNSDFPTGAQKAQWLADYIVKHWAELDKPCSLQVVDRAVEYCDDRAANFDADSAVLVHGDAHGWNPVSADDGQFKFVDPEGVWSERAHDLSVPMREYNEPLLRGNTALLTRQRAEHLARLCDVDPEPVWQWGFIERVSTGLANLRDFDGDAGATFLEVAERCL